jgi:hypothetical protein
MQGRLGGLYFCALVLGDLGAYCCWAWCCEYLMLPGMQPSVALELSLVPHTCVETFAWSTYLLIIA